MLEPTCLTLSISVVSILIFLFFISRSTQKTQNPSPDSYPLIGNIIAFLRNHRRFHDWVTEMLSKTPSLTLQVNAFLNLTHGIATANPINVEHILVTNFGNYVKGSRYQDLNELLGHGIFSVDGRLWATQRKIASHEFNTKSLKKFISDVVESEISDSLMPYLTRKYDQNSIFDLQEVLQKFTFTSICKVAFGVDPATTSNLPFVKAFDDAVENCFSRLLSPLPVIWKIKRYLNVGSEKKFKEDINIINRFAMEVINAKEEEKLEGHDENPGKNQDLLSRFMLLTSKMDFEDKENERLFLRDIIISFVLAGKDSTAVALTWFFWLIAGNPRCATMIYNELSSSKVAGEETPAKFSYDELKKLHYLHAALSESIRLFPPVAINTRLTVKDDILPDGTRVKRGWFADYSAYAMGRMESVWGPDCMEFKPERWLSSDGVFQPSDQFRYPVFHCGPRMCLGKDMAYVQMKAITASVMHEFDVLAVDGGASPERMINPPYMITMLLKMRGGLPVRLRRRERSGRINN